MEKENTKKGPVVLVILDGWGEWDNVIGNAVAQADLPTFDYLNANYPKLLLDASGPSVGLPWGVYGNSEVGHQTIGSGQIIFQYLSVIDSAIQSGELAKKEILIDIIENLIETGKALHLWGLVSDGGVHSHIDHILNILETARDKGLKKVFVHFISDGRDTNQRVAKGFVKKLEDKMADLGVGQIASLGGRYFAMDRNNNWDRIEKAYKTFIGQGERKIKDVSTAIDEMYKEDITDEYFEPSVVVGEDGQAIGALENGDALFCFNFRKDRARQMTSVFLRDDFKNFDIQDGPKVEYICMTEYDADLSHNVLFVPQKITTRVAELISKKGLKQLRIAETEKFAHVTYFFNGGVNTPYEGEDRIFVPSKNCKSYADVPEMSAYEVTDKLLEQVEAEKHDFILVNYANSDMVGHTGVLEAGIETCEVVDKCLSKLIEAVLNKNGQLIISADHGNIEEMFKVETGAVDTEHSTNPVPCWLVSNDLKQDKPLEPGMFSSAECIIADLAPTVLELLDIEAPRKMNGRSLVKLFYREA